MEEQSRKQQWWLALVGEGAADCQAVASDRLCFLILARCYTPLNFPNPSRLFLEFGLGVVIGLDDGLSSLLQIMELAELVRDIRQDLLHGQANWPLGI